MQIPKDRFNAVVLNYATTELLPQMGQNWRTWAIAGGLPLMMPVAHEMLERFGVENASGVNVEAIESFFTNAFNSVAKLDVPLLGIGFTAEDGHKLIAHLKRG